MLTYGIFIDSERQFCDDSVEKPSETLNSSSFPGPRMPLILSLIDPSATLPIEAQGLIPELLRDKSLAEIQHLPVLCGNALLPLGELFLVSGSAADGQMEFSGDHSQVHWIGSGMTTGSIRVTGAAGRHAGSGLAGGELVIDGNAGDWAGAEMRQGLIRIRGSVGAQAGGVYVGGTKGMTGGTLLIHGDAGHEAGRCLRRGLIAIGGRCGDFPGFNMLAGAMLVLGPSGVRPAAGMRRGTLALLHSTCPPVLPTFRCAAVLQPTAFRLILKRLEQLDFPFDAALYEQPLEIFRGDMVVGGKGEILRPVATSV